MKKYRVVFKYEDGSVYSGYAKAYTSNLAVKAVKAKNLSNVSLECIRVTRISKEAVIC